MARRRGGGRTIDFKTWAATPFSTSTISTATTAGGGGVSTGAQATVLRTRGYVQAIMDSTKQVGDTMLLTFGLGIVSSDAFAVGGGSLPDPLGDADYPWLWWGEMFLEAELAAAQEAWGGSAQRLEVDSKAMRRLAPSQTLAWVVQATQVAGAPAVSVTFGTTRVLFGT